VPVVLWQVPTGSNLGGCGTSRVNVAAPQVYNGYLLGYGKCLPEAIWAGEVPRGSTLRDPCGPPSIPRCGKKWHAFTAPLIDESQCACVLAL
jgi:hypothetical protein